MSGSRTIWEPIPDSISSKACALYHCPQCGTVMKPTPLTPTELEVFRAYAEGLTTAEMAEIRFTSESTIETHRRNILLKTGAPNLVRAVVLGIKQGVILV